MGGCGTGVFGGGQGSEWGGFKSTPLQVYSFRVQSSRVSDRTGSSYSNENDEPPHVHVQREQKLAKFWLGEVTLAESKRFAAHELREMERIVVERRTQFLEAWNEFFGS